MVQSTKNWCGQNAPDDLNRSRYRCVFAQRQMCVRRCNSACASAAGGADVARRTPRRDRGIRADQTDQPFTMSILPRRSRRRWSVTYADRADASGHLARARHDASRAHIANIEPSPQARTRAPATAWQYRRGLPQGDLCARCRRAWPNGRDPSAAPSDADARRARRAWWCAAANTRGKCPTCPSQTSDSRRRGGARLANSGHRKADGCSKGSEPSVSCRRHERQWTRIQPLVVGMVLLRRSSEDDVRPDPDRS